MTDNLTPSQRAAPRDSLLLRSELHRVSDGEPLAMLRIRNLSATGLMAECTVMLDVGERVRLTLRGVGEVLATISWQADGRLGLTFDAEVDPMAARRPISRNRPVSTAYGYAAAAPKNRDRH